MNDKSAAAANLAHLDEALFRAAVERTAHDFNFRPTLVEKDYFCSLLLQALAPPGSHWIFKGGTCLSKVYTDFYRLSEDLDFCISVTESVGRADRRRLIEPAKILVNDLSKRIAGIETLSPLTGRNVSTQYVALFRYRSAITGDWEKVKVEIGLREPLIQPAVIRSARTLLRDIFTGNEIVPAFPVAAMDLNEAMAEKTRAALTRREPAIRDFFDLDYAVKNMNWNLNDPGFMILLRQKLTVSGNAPVQLTVERHAALKQQQITDLDVVVRASDTELFDLDFIWNALAALADRLKNA